MEDHKAAASKVADSVMITTHIRIFETSKDNFVVYSSETHIADDDYDILGLQRSVYMYDDYAVSSDSKNITLKPFKGNCLQKEINVVGGKGLGQTTAVIEKNGDVLTVFPQLSVPLDETSKVTIVSHLEKVPVNIYKACIESEELIDAGILRELLASDSSGETYIQILQRNYQTSDCGLLIENYTTAKED